MSELDGSFRRTLIRGGIEKPSSLVLDPSEGWGHRRYFFFFFFHLRVKEAGLVLDWLISQSGGAWFEFHSDHWLNLFLIAQNSLDPRPRALSVNSQPVTPYRLAWGLNIEPFHVLFGWFAFSCLSGCLSTSWIAKFTSTMLFVPFKLYLLMRVLQR